jgi:hypothetical protein
MGDSMNYELISDEEYEKLPEDHEECFAQFVTTCDRNVLRLINSDNSGYFDRSVKAQYMANVSAVAVECGISKLSYLPVPQDHSEFYETFRQFSVETQGKVARIRVRRRRSRSTQSVQLTDNTRTKIQHYVSRLREAISNSDLSGEQKTRLRIKIDEMEDELGQQRLSFGKIMAILSAVTFGLAATTTIAADGPMAIIHIMSLIGADKQSQDDATSRLTPPQKALAAPTEGSVTAITTAAVTEAENEIPF